MSPPGPAGKRETPCARRSPQGQSPPYGCSAHLVAADGYDTVDGDGAASRLDHAGGIGDRLEQQRPSCGVGGKAWLSSPNGCARRFPLQVVAAESRRRDHRRSDRPGRGRRRSAAASVWKWRRQRVGPGQRQPVAIVSPAWFGRRQGDRPPGRPRPENQSRSGENWRPSGACVKQPLLARPDDAGQPFDVAGRRSAGRDASGLSETSSIVLRRLALTAPWPSPRRMAS